MTKKIQFIGSVSLMLSLFVLTTGCASGLLKKPDPPIVSVSAVRPLNLSLLQQRLGFTLLVKNPNAFDLPLEALEFVASFAKNEIASGFSDQAVIIPGNGEATLEVEVTASVSKIFSQLEAMLNSQSISLDYGVKGTVKLSNWPTKIPFDVEGQLQAPKTQ
jgi:LEA14-like dessication related protein